MNDSERYRKIFLFPFFTEVSNGAVKMNSYVDLPVYIPICM